LDVVELRGNESTEMCEDLGSEVEVIKAFKITKDVDIDELVEPYDEVCDYYLFETDHSFDRTIFKKYRIEKPFFLSGAIAPADAQKVKSFQHPDFFGVDINEKFEKSSGVKDMVAILQFKQNLKK
jgi:phosphoribosylanthranilate isomerase